MHALGGRDQVVRALRSGVWDAFEAPLPSVVVQLVRRWPQTVLDVGANTGLYSLVAVTAHHRAQAVAYEPVPEIAGLLRDNLAANPQGRRVTVREVAVGDETGPTELHLPPPQPDGTIETSASLEPDFKESIERVVPVQASTLDDAWSAEGRPAVSVVKIDVEGSEHRVLLGASQLVAQCRPVLTIEVLTGAEVDALERFRREWDYVDVTLGPTEAVVNRPSVQPDPQSPNHLLVPWERLSDTVDDLRAISSLTVTLLS
jgi:FkbM family methyltransferase